MVTNHFYEVHDSTCDMKGKPQCVYMRKVWKCDNYTYILYVYMHFLKRIRKLLTHASIFILLRNISPSLFLYFASNKYSILLNTKSIYIIYNFTQGSPKLIYKNPHLNSPKTLAVLHGKETYQKLIKKLYEMLV